ncbi:MAG TPA: transglutaminase-like domain-containing protein [Thermoclostridium caenicola]|uniref:Transglutaminase-like superfamily protein n=1 Tax=Thermoclostridium caenicola TaxID=659425 RepID=A0A1M6AFI5_9FIRM|nr:transglutaminase-like domain-containing protein [Thermoclostridium caenicola]SHI35172.1 Transglutaminase-like superfamily protein [Thermoclostridium caenicola]HOK42100.1 transglutaminase-like domain-containing protein [Thermoclostridium caenicola]HOL84092.1 transglutaminase-like domain-containing protein [Thermoclostridium caenicola]HPO76145.1 transglutaminase-like domain-containing protein [Thermoclostridium caenicola]
MLKVLIALIVGASLIGSPIAQVNSEFDNTRVPDGSVGARYAPAAEKRTKTRVQKSEDTYDYDLFGRNSFEYFPLQLGNGSYQVVIFENIQGTKYRAVRSQNIKAEMDNPLKVFLASIQTVNWNQDMETIKKAKELTAGLKTDREKIGAIYRFVVENLSYDYDKINNIPTTYVPNIDEILRDGKGICYDYSAVFAAMLRSQGIPCKLIKGYSTNVKGYHAWNEVYLADEDRWMIVDTTYDSVVLKGGKKVDMEKPASQYTKSREY